MVSQRSASAAALVALAAVFSSVSWASAGTATSTMTVSATVVNTCTVTAAPLAFGTYNPNGSEVLATASITTLCTPGASATLSMNTGTFRTAPQPVKVCPNLGRLACRATTVAHE